MQDSLGTIANATGITVDNLQIIMAVLLGGFIVPLVEWIKKKLPADVPLKAPFLSLVFIVAATWALSRWLAPTLTVEGLIDLILTSQVTSQFVAASKDTVKKVTIGG